MQAEGDKSISDGEFHKGTVLEMFKADEDIAFISCVLKTIINNISSCSSSIASTSEEVDGKILLWFGSLYSSY